MSKKNILENKNMKQIKYLFFLILLIFLISNCFSKDDEYSKYLGAEYYKLNELKAFKDFKCQQSRTVEGLYKSKFGLDHYKKDNINLIIFDEIVRYDKGKPIFKMLDILEIKDLKKDEEIDFTLCTLDKKTDNEIITIFKHDDKDVFKKIIIKAWRANRNIGKFEIINDIKEIECIETEY